MNILIGCDPEIFLKDHLGRSRAPTGIIPGTKAEPFKVDKGAVQQDGMAAEFNIDPVDNEDDFVTNINTVMEQMRQMLPKGWTFDISPTARFHHNHMRAQPEYALELGCEPDYCAWTDGAENPRPDNRTTMRTASGHVHIGFTEGAEAKSAEHMMKCVTLVKQLDAYLGLPSLLWDSDRQRRSMYGQAGAFRPKSYGVEYRTMSNRWLSDEKLMRYVFRQSVQAVKHLMAGKRVSERAYFDHLPTYINNSYHPSYVKDLMFYLIGNPQLPHCA